MALDKRVVEVRWLSEWRSRDLARWKSVGLEHFNIPVRVPGRRRSWQSNVVVNWMTGRDDQLVIWTDDELTRSRLRGFDRERLLAIAPDPQVGLTHEHIDRIEDWIKDNL